MEKTDSRILTKPFEQGFEADGTGIFSSSPVFFSSAHTVCGERRVSVTREQIRSARMADLAGFLLRSYPNLFRDSGNSIYMKSRDSVYIRKGFPGYTDFSSGRHGNPIDFLTGCLGYSFVDAVTALTEGTPCGAQKAEPQEEPPIRRPISLPESADRPYRRIYAYLTGRGIPSEMIRLLEQCGILYQERTHGSAVFVNPERDYCELRGTLTCAPRPFHACLKSKPNRFWYFLNTGKKPTTAYICESAIDAISLSLLQCRKGEERPAVYISIGGVSNQKTIERVKLRMPAVLAVDNDMAGASCRERNRDMPFLIPAAKDWNEDLLLTKP